MPLRRVLATALFALTLAVTATPAAHAALWDANQNRIDDRIEAVNTNGLAAAHVGNVLSGRLILFVYPDAHPLAYGVYVRYDHAPTELDVAALTGAGAELLWRPRYIPYLRARATFTQIQAIAALPGVGEVEAWQVMYPTNDIATRTLRARETAGGAGSNMFPSTWRNLGVTGRGKVVGIIDTGVNDAPSNTYPGHESLRGKFVGGGNFSNPDASLNTPADSSANPMNAADAEGSYHATHVAGTAIGSGGPTGVLPPGSPPGPYAGMAPDAWLVDCKALSDAGVGGGAAEALEWCIAHRNTVWGADALGVTYRGVQVVNMSLGGVSASDGNDADCAAVNAATLAGIVVCVATGNDGKTAYMPSPAAADLDISVGAFQDANSIPHADDIVANYSNEGPRLADADSDHLDEMKPSVCGSGSDIVSALGDPTTDGTRYHNINGTSMATPTIAGLCALILQANPTLTPLQVRDILQNTAEHRTDHGKQPAGSADPFSLDPNYHPSWGWGEPDAYAAVKEAMNSAGTQVVSEGAVAAILAGQLQVTVRWSTQRESGVAAFSVSRAADAGGVAQQWATVSPAIAPTGHRIIERTSNRTSYVWTDLDAALVAGAAYWYQVRWTDTQGFAHVEPAFRITTDTPPLRARVTWVITHNALDNDVFARFGSGTDPNHAAFVRPCGGSTSADSSRTIIPVGFGTSKRYYFHADLRDRDLVSGFLPPSAANPWFLSVLEKGYVNTEGIVDSFSVTVYETSGTTTYRSPQPSTATAEGQITTMWIPLNPATTLNHTPVLDPIGPRSVGEGLALAFQVHATDAEPPAVTLSVTGLPPGAAFDAPSGAFHWTPGYGQAGSYAITFHATDAMSAADSERVTVDVSARVPGSNTSPTLDPIVDPSGPAGASIVFTATAHDAEDDALQFAAAPLPPGAVFYPSTGNFAWTTFPEQAGVYHFTVHVTDSHAAADSQFVTVTITPAAAITASSCTPDTMTFTGTVGANAQGLQVTNATHSFMIEPGTAHVQGALNWTGGPAIDLDLYLLDANGNTVASGATATADPEHLTFANPAPGSYRWQVSAYDNPNPNEAYTVTSIRCTGATLGTGVVEGPAAIALAQNFPNPFTRTSVIRFAIPRSQQASLRIFDISGRQLRTLADGPLQAGMYQRVWDGRSDAGERLAAGVYFYSLVTAEGTRNRRMVMLK